MEVATKNFLASSPPPFASRTHLKNCSFSSSPSVLMLHEQAAPAVTYAQTASLARYPPISVPSQNHPLNFVKDDETSQATMGSKLTVASFTRGEEKDSPDQLGEGNYNHRVPLLHMPGLWYLFPPSDIIQSFQHKAWYVLDVEVANAVDLARKALSASRVAAVLAEDPQLLAADVDASPSPSLPSSNLAKLPLEEERSVRSRRLLERRSKRRRVPNPKVVNQVSELLEKKNTRRKKSQSSDQSDRLWLFVDLETKLLNAKEECDLIMKIQDCMRLEEVRSRLHNQFGREPLLFEWAKAVGLSCRALQSQLRVGNGSREKLIHANYRLVVHIAKQYQGHGLNLHDLLQEGSMGLMKSVEKFKPQAGCRFATYAYWWIRQAIRKAICQHSRTIRLPDNVYGLLSKVKDAKRICIQQGVHYPTKEEVARCAGMTVEKLDRLQSASRMPLSLQQSVWTDQDATLQEVTADTSVEVPAVTVEKQLMRLHIRNLLGMLNPRERKIIRLRFGIEDGNQKSLSEIGAVFGLSKERVRQLEYRALCKLKQCLDSHGLEAYGDLLV